MANNDEYAGYAVHRVAPYIGSLRPSLARQLILRHSKPDDLVWDPFCGAGSVPYECRLLSRHCIAADVNPYACAVTRAKLHAPTDEKTALFQLRTAFEGMRSKRNNCLVGVPLWVRRFFHRRTLSETLSLAREFRSRRQYFNLGCLLGILHHQRPGFLSYPASHLVPYLRDHLYPREKCPEAYNYRDPLPRMAAKIARTLENPPPFSKSRQLVLQMSVLYDYLPPSTVDAVITSPPYMDALDYARDNRLRLWFLGVADYKCVQKQELRGVRGFEANLLLALLNVLKVVRSGGKCILVLGDVRSSSNRRDVARIVCDMVARNIKGLVLEERRAEAIPNRRRARKNGRATKIESILVFRVIK